MSDSSDRKTALRITYSGQVQGVGFRATAVHLARGYPDVTGWVRNLPDGRVELWAEGSPDRVQAFRRAVLGAWPPGYIDDEQVETHDPAGHTAFQVRH